MREEIKFWIEDARYDSTCAKDMLEKKRFNYAVFLSRQAVEKMLKAAELAVSKKAITKEHNLVQLAKKIFKKIPVKIADDLTFLNPHYTISRYVNAALGPPSQLYDKEIAKEALQRAERVMKWLRKTLGVKG